MSGAPSFVQLFRLALIALTIPTLYGLAVGDEDWIFAAFASLKDIGEHPVSAIEAPIVAGLIVWIGVISANWFPPSRSASMLIAAAVAGALLWPFIDQREFVSRMFESYDTIRRFEWRFWFDQPRSTAEGALIGFFGILAWMASDLGAVRKPERHSLLGG